MTALPGGNTAVIIEANAIRHSPIGELMVQCLGAKGQGDPFEQFRERTGIDLLKDLDRIAVTENGLTISGNFQNARWDEGLGVGRSTPYGDQGALYTSVPQSQPDGEQVGPSFGAWNGQMFIIGQSADEIRSALDRLEGRAPVGAPAILDESSYGEIYGVISAEQLARLIGRDNAEFAERLRGVAQHIELHVDTRKDVAVVADVRGPDAAGVSDLGKSLGAMLSLAQLQARVQQESDLAELVELARIEPGEARFNLELALPMAFLEKHLAWCREGVRPRARRDH